MEVPQKLEIVEFMEIPKKMDDNQGYHHDLGKSIHPNTETTSFRTSLSPTTLYHLVYASPFLQSHKHQKCWTNCWLYISCNKYIHPYINPLTLSLIYVIYKSPHETPLSKKHIYNKNPLIYSWLTSLRSARPFGDGSRPS